MMSFDRPDGHQPRTADDPRAALRVTVEDLATGEKSEEIVLTGDYVLVTAAPCYMALTQMYRGGQTHVITVKDRTP